MTDQEPTVTERREDGFHGTSAASPPRSVTADVAAHAATIREALLQTAAEAERLSGVIDAMGFPGPHLREWRTAAVDWQERALAAEARAAAAETALRKIAAQQQKTLGWLEANGVVFDGPLGTDPSNWQHVAFSIYADLCEMDTWAWQGLDEPIGGAS